MSADYPEEPQQPWEHSRCCCQHSQQHHSPQAEPEAERTQADGADVENIHEDITGGGEAEETEAVKESNFTAVSEADVGPDSVIGLNESLREHKDGGGKIDLGVPEEDLAGVLEELELSLKMTSMMEQEKMEHLSRSTETETSCSTVRRRNKRRRAKKASHWTPTADKLEPGPREDGCLVNQLSSEEHDCWWTPENCCQLCLSLLEVRKWKHVLT